MNFYTIFNSRVHCTNLFEEMVIQKLKLENELKNETLIEEAAMTNDTVEILGQLFDTSGCKKQICETCDIAMVDPKDFKESNWYCMQARVKVE